VDDPRFASVTRAELPDLHIEINAMTPLSAIQPDEIEVGRHGLYLVLGNQAGLLLPEVPLNYGWDREMFLAALCRKAGLPLDAWQHPTCKLWGFETEIWEEPY
jgi:uncharacterized protein (TIGR00296 family)